MEKNKIYLISEFAELVGVSVDNIRYYQKRGLFPIRRKESNGYRYFLEEDIEKFKKLKSVGKIPNEVKEK